MTNTTPQPNLPSVEEVVEAYEAIVKSHRLPPSSWIRQVLTERDAAHQEAMGEAKGTPANKKVLLEALKTIGWDMRGNYPNERIVDHNGKNTCYRVLNDGVQVLGVSENSATDFYFKTAKVQVLEDGNAVSLGTDDCFILFMNHTMPNKAIARSRGVDDVKSE